MAFIFALYISIVRMETLDPLKTKVTCIRKNEDGPDCTVHVSISLYNAITQNKREIDWVHKNELYIATVSIKQKAVDRIKTALRFVLYATRISARMTSKTTMLVTSVSAIVMDRYVNEQTDEKKMILQRKSL